MAERKEQGLKTTDKGTYIEPKDRVPYNPDNKFKSKAQFIADELKRKENEMKVKEYAAELKKETGDKKETKLKPKKIE
jgi:hypothetical protein